MGGLLHDIGKFVQRAYWDEKKDHSIHGEEFLKSFSNPIMNELALFARYHHKEELEKVKDVDTRRRNLLWIVYEADNLSSSEREKGTPVFGNPLISVFSSINVGKGLPRKFAYKLTELRPEKFVYPIPREDLTLSRRSYEELFKSFRRDFGVISRNISIEHLLVLLEKYTTFIPSIMSEENDVSLFDHLRTTSAIALCLYYFHKEDLDKDIKNEITNKEKLKFLFVGGDVSGVQRFIYTITSKGALKYLRARSTFLELLVEDVVEEILRELRLTRANVVYSGGGHFYILAPNLPEVRSKLVEIRNKVNKWLFENFWCDLYLALDWVEINGKAFETLEINGRSIWQLISEKLTKLKNQKFKELIFNNPRKLVEENYLENKFECDVCKRPTATTEQVKEDVKVCESCKNLWSLGENLPRIDALLRIDKNHPINKKFEGLYPKIELPFSAWYGLFRVGNWREVLSDVPKDGVLFLKNFLQVDENLLDYRIIPFLVSDYAIKENGEIKNFDKMGEDAKGVKKIAALRMDVDDLGKIFSTGIPEGKRTISRVATLSRLLNYFFRSYINLIAEYIENNVVGICENSNLPRLVSLSDRKDRNVVVVYSGGDDLFIVGAWNDVFEMSFEIQELFTRYVGYNPNITISAGFGIFDPKYPLYRMAELTKDRLEKAKDEGKNRIFIFERAGEFGGDEKMKENHRESYEWEEFKIIWQKYAAKIYDTEKRELKDEVSRAIIRKLLEAWKIYVKNPRSAQWFISPLYHLSRVGVSQYFSALFTLDVERIRKGEPQEVYYIDCPLRILDLIVRR